MAKGDKNVKERECLLSLSQRENSLLLIHPLCKDNKMKMYSFLQPRLLLSQYLLFVIGMRKCDKIENTYMKVLNRLLHTY